MRLLAFVLGPVYLTAESVVDRFSSCSMRETMEINSLQSRNPYLFGVCLNSSLIVDALRSRNPSLIGVCLNSSLIVDALSSLKVVLFLDIFDRYNLSLSWVYLSGYNSSLVWAFIYQFHFLGGLLMDLPVFRTLWFTYSIAS